MATPNPLVRFGRACVRLYHAVIVPTWGFYTRWGWLFGLIIMFIVICLLLSGCAAGRGDAGEVVVGFEVGRMVETTNQGLHVAAGFLPPPWNGIAEALLPIATGVGGMYVTKAARDKADALYDEGHAKGLLLAAVQAAQQQPVPIGA